MRLAFAIAFGPAIAPTAMASDIITVKAPVKMEQLADTFRKAALAERLEGLGETKCLQITSSPIPGRQPPQSLNCTIRHACFNVQILEANGSETSYMLAGKRSETCTKSLLASARAAFANSFVSCSSEKGRKASIERLMTTDHTEYQRDPMAEWQPPSQTLVQSPLNEARVDIKALCKTMSGRYQIVQRGPNSITENVSLLPVARAKRKGR